MCFPLAQCVDLVLRPTCTLYNVPNKTSNKAPFKPVMANNVQKIHQIDEVRMAKLVVTRGADIQRYILRTMCNICYIARLIVKYR